MTKVDLLPNNEPSSIYSQVFDHWRVAYERLITTSGDFLAECSHLDSVLKQPGARNWPLLEESLVYVDTALASLNTWASHIRGALAILGTARNQSKSLVPFKQLPFELIVNILSLTATKCPIDHRSPFDKVNHWLFAPITMSMNINLNA
ncbi:hypothetical protein FRC12_017015 [Ceratobasidium sp. 428]|nr:hypothetical protein FRC12_017015 [Ceratobasidium sp. 428]